MRIGYHPRASTPGHVEGVWYRESEPKLTWEPPGPRIVALEHAEQSREQDAPAGAGAHRGGGDALERGIERRSCPSKALTAMRRTQVVNRPSFLNVSSLALTVSRVS
jgi:hypothetical protein